MKTLNETSDALCAALVAVSMGTLYTDRYKGDVADARSGSLMVSETRKNACPYAHFDSYPKVLSPAECFLVNKLPRCTQILGEVDDYEALSCSRGKRKNLEVSLHHRGDLCRLMCNTMSPLFLMLARNLQPVLISSKLLQVFPYETDSEDY